MMMNFANVTSEPFAEHVLSGDSLPIRRLRMQITRIAPHFRLAIVTGESGTGKLAVAHEMHRLSPVAHRPLCVVSIATFVQRYTPESELARAGMLVLRGLGSAEASVQQALLLQLQLLPRDTRIVFTSGAGLKGLLAAGRLEHALAQRLGTLEIRVPSLRQRIEDVGLLASEMLGAGERSFSPAALECLRDHSWRGNLTELWQLCHQLSDHSLPIQPEHLPALDQGTLESTGLRLEDVMRRHVKDVLARCSGNKVKAAELLGISRSTLYRMMGTEV